MDVDEGPVREGAGLLGFFVGAVCVLGLLHPVAQAEHIQVVLGLGLSPMLLQSLSYDPMRPRARKVPFSAEELTCIYLRLAERARGPRADGSDCTSSRTIHADCCSVCEGHSAPTQGNPRPVWDWGLTC